MNLSNAIMDLWDKYDLGTVETCRTLKECLYERFCKFHRKRIRRLRLSNS